MKKLTIPLALMLTLFSCTPGDGVDPEPDPSDSTVYPLPDCAYTITYVVTSEREWTGTYLTGNNSTPNTSGKTFPTLWTFTDSIWSVTNSRVTMRRKLYDSLPMNVNVKIYYDDILVKNVTKLLKNNSVADPNSSYLTVYGGLIYKCD